MKTLTLTSDYSRMARGALPLAVALICLAGARQAWPQTFNAGTNLVDSTRIKGNETDPSIVVNPLIPTNLFVVAATDRAGRGLVVATTTNLGTTWATNIIATNNDAQGLPPAYGMPSAAWDVYGNLYVAYLPATFEGVAVVVSTNGGQNFTTVTNLAALEATDQPRITTPAAGAGAGTVWVVYKNYTQPGTPLVVQGLQSTGLGSNGGFGPVEMVPNSTDGGFADIVAGPAGQVMVAFQNNINGTNLSSIFVTVITNAVTTNGLGTNDFPVPVAVVSDAIGGFTYIPAEQSGIGINAAPGLGWDSYKYGTNVGKAYLIYTAMGTNGFLIINLCYSADGGATWSAEQAVDDDAANATADHFYPRLAVDPSTGIIGCSWYDCRNDQGSSSRSLTKTANYILTLTGLSVTNIKQTSSANGSITFTWTDVTGGGTNLTLNITGNNINGIQVTNDSGNNIYLYGPTATNLELSVQGDATNLNAIIAVSVVDNYPNAYSGGGSPDQEPILYGTASLDGGNTFLANQPWTSFALTPNPPAIGFASSVVGSGNLTGWGHYTGLAAFGGNFYPAWADNADTTSKNPDGDLSGFDINVEAGGTGGTSVPTANLSVWVTNSPNPVVSEGVLVYTLVVSNLGATSASGVVVTNTLATNVTFESVIPALGITYVNNLTNIVFAIPNLGAGKALTNTIRVTATSSAWATNTATVYSPVTDLNPPATTNILVLLIAGEDLELGMSTSETNVLIGDTVSNYMTVINNGPSANAPAIITNTFSANWTNLQVQTPGTYFITNNTVVINLGLLPTNQPVTSVVTATALSVGTYASNSATVWSLDVDTNLANNSATNIYYVNGEDLAIGVTSPGSVNLGQTINFTISVTNLGPSTNGLITVQAAISTNLGQFTASQSQGSYAVTSNVVVFALGALDAGQTATLNISAVALGGPATATLNATVSSQDFDTNMANNTVLDTVTVNGEDLSIAMSPSATSLQVGQTVTYTEMVTNWGPSTNGIVVVSNSLSAKLGQIAVVQPAGNYSVNGNVVVINLGTMAAGQGAPIVVTAVAQAIGSATNAASVFSTAFDTNVANNSAVSVVSIVAALPMISNVVVSAAASSAFISWRTGALATGQVQYGLTPAYGSLSSVSTLASSNHVVMLTGLARDTSYYYNILSWVAGKLYATNGTFATTSTLILNTGDAQYSGFWTASSVANGIYGSYYQSANTTNTNPTAAAAYVPKIPAAGNYNVSIWHPQNTNYTTNAQVYISGATNELLLSVNQTTNGGSWQLLANDVYFASGTGGNVTIYNDTGETSRTIVANAMRWDYDPAQDSPTNGTVPAWWATYYFGTNAYANPNASGSADADGDGYSNYAEYVFGTDPTDAASHLNFNVTALAGNQVAVTFAPYQGGRSYQLQYATNLLNPAWTPLTNTATANTNGWGVFTVTEPNAAGAFYQLTAQILPQ